MATDYVLLRVADGVETSRLDRDMDGRVVERAVVVQTRPIWWERNLDVTPTGRSDMDPWFGEIDIYEVRPADSRGSILR